jgi:hypothetical protein
MDNYFIWRALNLNHFRLGKSGVWLHKSGTTDYDHVVRPNALVSHSLTYFYSSFAGQLTRLDSKVHHTTIA